MDAYKARKFIDRYTHQQHYLMACENEAPRDHVRFILTPQVHFDGEHNTTMVHILNQKTQRLMATVFLNSAPNDCYTNEIARAFMDGMEYVSQKGALREEKYVSGVYTIYQQDVAALEDKLKKQFKAGMVADEFQDYRDESAKIAYVLNEERGASYSSNILKQNPSTNENFDAKL